MSSKKIDFLSHDAVLRRMAKALRIDKYSVLNVAKAICDDFDKTPKQMADALHRWKTQGVVLDTVVAFSAKRDISVDWLLYDKGQMKQVDVEHAGAWIGTEGLSREQREIIEMIGQDRIFARSFMMMYETIVSRYREVREPGPLFPVKDPGPEVGIAEKEVPK